MPKTWLLSNRRRISSGAYNFHFKKIPKRSIYVYRIFHWFQKWELQLCKSSGLQMVAIFHFSSGSFFFIFFCLFLQIVANFFNNQATSQKWKQNRRTYKCDDFVFIRLLRSNSHSKWKMAFILRSLNLQIYNQIIWNQWEELDLVSTFKFLGIFVSNKVSFYESCTHKHVFGSLSLSSFENEYLHSN